MSAPDVGAGGGAAWFERAAVPRLPDTAASVPGVLARDEELAAIALRAERIGIPAWRVMVALGLPLPRPPAT
jgi:hypothetical protein